MQYGFSLYSWCLPTTTEKSHNSYFITHKFIYLPLKGLQKMSYSIIISLPFVSFFANFLPFVYSIRWFGLNIRQARDVDKFA